MNAPIVIGGAAILGAAYLLSRGRHPTEKAGEPTVGGPFTPGGAGGGEYSSTYGGGGPMIDGSGATVTTTGDDGGGDLGGGSDGGGYLDGLRDVLLDPFVHVLTIPPLIAAAAGRGRTPTGGAAPRGADAGDGRGRIASATRPAANDPAGGRGRSRVGALDARGTQTRLPGDPDELRSSTRDATPDELTRSGPATEADISRTPAPDGRSTRARSFAADDRAAVAITDIARSGTVRGVKGGARVAGGALLAVDVVTTGAEVVRRLEAGEAPVEAVSGGISGLDAAEARDIARRHRAAFGVFAPVTAPVEASGIALRRTGEGVVQAVADPVGTVEAVGAATENLGVALITGRSADSFRREIAQNEQTTRTVQREKETLRRGPDPGVSQAGLEFRQQRQREIDAQNDARRAADIAAQNRANEERLRRQAQERAERKESRFR